MIKITPYYERPNAPAILKCYLNLVADVVPFRPEDVLYGVEIEPDSRSNTPRNRYFPQRGGNQNRISAYVKLLNDEDYKIDPNIPARDQDALLAKKIISKYSSNLYDFLYDKPSSDKPGAVNRENLRRLLTTTFHQGNTPYEYSEKTPGTAALLRDHVFRYDAFSQKRYPETKRSVYQLLTLLGVSVCPYCNRQYITTVIHGRQSVRPQIDHFFCKKDYPYLALSINNLVPSCSVCNLQKHDRNKKILYPYEEELGESFIFRARYIDKLTDEKKHREYLIDQTQDMRAGVARFDLKSGIEEKKRDGAYIITSLLQGSKDALDTFRITLEKSEENLDSDYVIRAENSMEMLDLEHLYQSHKDYVLNLFLQRYVFTEDYFSAIQARFPKLFKTVDDVKHIIRLMNYSQKEWGQHPLAKLTHDIVEQIDELYTQ